VHDWDGFGRLFERSSVDLVENVKSSLLTAQRAAVVIKERQPTFTFIHFDDVDHAGHSFNWKSPQYYKAVDLVDTLIADLIAAIDSTPMKGKTLVLITADHGGVGTKHGGADHRGIGNPVDRLGAGRGAGQGHHGPGEHLRHGRHHRPCLRTRGAFGLDWQTRFDSLRQQTMSADSSAAKPTWSQEGDINTTSERERWEREELADSTRELIAEDARHFLHQALSTPCLNALAGAEGSWLIDVEGRRYLDFHGNNVHQIGYSHPRVIAAVKAQLDSLSFSVRRYTNGVAVDLARRLTELAPGDLNRVLFAPAGTIAMSMALKIARLATGRFKTVSSWMPSMGPRSIPFPSAAKRSSARASARCCPARSTVRPVKSGAARSAAARPASLGCADYIDYVLEREGDVAAVIGETIRCTPSVPPPDYWKRVRAACDRHGALLILDEIPIGLGRSGRFFAFEHYDVVPDLVVLGKGLGGGVMPLAAVIAREGLNTVDQSSIGHFTHEKSPVACAAALATLDVIRDERLVERAATLGKRALADLEALAARHPLVGAVRGLGLLLGVELLHGGDPARPARDEATRVMYAALRRGLNFKLTRGNMLTLTPPMNLTDDEWAQALRILDESLTEVETLAPGQS
jgi:4-aminobutyrate aminotransferase